MINKILSTDNHYSGLFLRLALAIVILPHGYQKISDFSNLLDILETHYSLPPFIGSLVILIEFFSALLLLFGVFSRINAALLGIVLLGAGFYHLENGFYMNWFGIQAGEGIQFHVLFILTALASAFSGGGKWSIDRILAQKFLK